MTKFILATLIAFGFSAFADHHEDSATETPPAAEDMAPTEDASAAKPAAKKTAKGKKAMTKGMKGKRKAEAAPTTEEHMDHN
jgi:hypothetical protein